jgi:hypothetical protein
MEDLYDWQTILFYGDFGVGKTHLAGTAVLVPEMCDVLYISLEGGEKTLKEVARICRKNKIDPNKIMVVPVSSYKQYSYVYEFLKIHVKARDTGDIDTLRKLEGQVRGLPADVLADPVKLNLAIPEPKQFKTVISDSLTEAQKYCMYQILGIDPLTQKLDAEPDAAQFQDWGKSREMIQFLVRRYRDLPINSIFICGETKEQDAKKQYYFEPTLPGKLSDDIRGLVDTVGYVAATPLEGGKVSRRVYLVGGMYGIRHIAAKHRYGTKLKTLWVENPTMQTFFDLGDE